MPSKDPTLRLRDIVENIQRIEHYVHGMDFDSFIADQRTVDAVERCLQRITEAARKLGKELEQQQPEVLWKMIRNMGSVLRHDYEQISMKRLWGTVTTDLAPLRAACEAELTRRGKGQGDS